MKTIGGFPIINHILTDNQMDDLSAEANFTWGDAAYTLVEFANLPTWVQAHIHCTWPLFDVEEGTALVALIG